MKRRFLHAKLHQATITQCQLEYEGSISIDQALLSATNILPNEQVHVYNMHNGNRFITYAISAPAHSGMICVNGACARLAIPKDRIIICTYVDLDLEAAKIFKPTIVLLDKQNKIRH